MNNKEFEIELEKPIHNSIDDLFNKAKLSDEEKEVFLKIRNYCEYWLLRTKYLYSKSFDAKHPSFIQRLARVLIRFFSEDVEGQKMTIIKEMFPKKTSIHHVSTSTKGIRSKQKSAKIENTYFELEIMSFFLDNAYKIELASNKVKDKKIPEFTATVDNLRINIEAKQLDIDIVLDKIFGDYFTQEIGHRLSEDERNEGYKKIQKQLKNSYENAISKYFDINKDEFFLIFISIDYNLNSVGNFCNKYLRKLLDEWSSEKYNNLLGLVVVEPEKTNFIDNPKTDREIIKRLNNIGISKYHLYIP